jgi:acyl-CoA:acyl-CoA alkyltransferase
MIRSRIAKVAGFTTGAIVTSSALEEIINQNTHYLPKGIIELKFGVKERIFAGKDIQASDLAVGAATQILKEIDPKSIDLLIFAAGSSDLIEPATSNIIQSKLKLKCPCFDIKNACNSFVNGLQVADAFIKSGQYKNILIVSGEKLSTIIKFNPENKKDIANRLACLSMCDGGGAVLLEASDDESGIIHQTFETFGDHWELCTIPGGGSMFPHDPSKVYFEGHTKELRDIFLKEKGRIVETCFAEAGWQFSDIDHVFLHHVSKSTFDLVSNSLDIPIEKFYSVIENYGNMASATIPFAMSKAEHDGILKKGDKVLCIGLASGISIGIQLMIW